MRVQRPARTLRRRTTRCRQPTQSRAATRRPRPTRPLDREAAGRWHSAWVAAPPSLNPGIGDPAFAALYQWAYDSLVILQPDGTFAPNLAVEFGYTDDRNMRYELTLREGVKFSDGTDLDAEALKGYFEYVRSQPTSLAQLLARVVSESPRVWWRLCSLRGWSDARKWEISGRAA